MDNNSERRMTLYTDSILVVIYSPELNLSKVFEDSAFHEDGETTLNIVSYLSV